jgi:nucleotide-binding universal stress UspA family protein
MAPFSRILHPTDFSGPAGRAFTPALALAKAHRAELTIAHVLVPPMPPIGDMHATVPPSVYEALATAARRRAQSQLARLVVKAKGAKVRARGLLLEGIPHEQIVRRAKRADLIVIGTLGRTGLPRLFLGSVAARVVALARCPVLTVRAR